MFFKPNGGAEFEIWAVSLYHDLRSTFCVATIAHSYFQWDYHDWDSEHWPMPYATCEGQIWYTKLLFLENFEISDLKVIILFSSSEIFFAANDQRTPLFRISIIIFLVFFQVQEG